MEDPGTTAPELTGIGEPVPTGPTGVAVGVKVMVERLVVGTQVVTVITEVESEGDDMGKGATLLAGGPGTTDMEEVQTAGLLDEGADMGMETGATEVTAAGAVD